MGVPKFFRYISERYPCLSELAREQSIPEFDNLYLDMNGIIHNCSHPDDGNVHFRISEDEMFKDIFKYIEKLFFLIKPQKLFFMAIDGVAPRAKMNQQRGRRFRSAKDAETLEKNAKERGEKLPDVVRFDSNCITPGTAFMDRLHQALKLFIRSKICNDPLWKNCCVILSGHDTPGEGEHKIMDYIRYLKTFDDYDPSTRHCLYGLDADLIILGLCTHARHFSLLREEVKFQKNQKRTTIEETRFFLMHLGLLREYLEIEFIELEMYPSFDINKLIDDWILLGFLVGNDFIPHLPNLHINTNALPILYKVYITIWPTLGGNINECGELNLERLDKFFTALSETEFEIFKEGYADLKYFQAKQSNGVDEAFDFDVEKMQNFSADDDLENFVKQSEEFLGELNDMDPSTFDGIEHIDEEFRLFKRNYYISKLKYEEMTPEVLKEQTQCYITALQWILYYYYKGVQSWGWYYPHHYAPFVSDMNNFKDLKIHFDMGKPFFPFEQLLAVLPAASKDLLPEAFRELMTNANSELLNYYPNDFETDLNGKKNEWEAIVLIPFIDEETLLTAMDPCKALLSENEVRRNTFGPMIQYDHSEEQHNGFQCSEKLIWREDILIAREQVKVDVNHNGLVYYPGFPTMKHLEYDSEIRNVRIRVFEQPSRNESVILIPNARDEFNDLQLVASKFLNKVVYVGWPLLTKAKVRAISSRDQLIDSEGTKTSEAKLFEMHVRSIKEHHINRMGIDFKNISVIIHANIFNESNYTYSNGKMMLNEIWSPIDVVYPAQGVVFDIDVHSSIITGSKKIEEIFPVNSRIFFVGNPYFGSEGKVLDPLLVYDCGRLKVSITALPEPDFTEAKYIQKQEDTEYMNLYELAGLIGKNSNIISRITGTILVIQGERTGNTTDNVKKINIGLRLKFPKQQEEIMGYTRKVGNTWLYSKKAAHLVQRYYEKFPSVFNVFTTCGVRDVFYESDIFSNTQDGETQLNEIVSWIKEQDHTQADRVSNGTKAIEKEAVEAVLLAIEELKTLPVKTVKLQVKPHLLMKPELSLPAIYRPRRILRLFDRVVVVKNTYQVPIGFKGTIVAIHPVVDLNPLRMECTKSVENFYEIVFDKNLPGGNGIYGIALSRVCKVPESAVLVIFNPDFKQPEVHSNVYDSQSISSNEKKIQANVPIPSQTQKSSQNDSVLITNTDNFWKPSVNSKSSTTFNKTIETTNELNTRKAELIKNKNGFNSQIKLKDPMADTTKLNPNVSLQEFFSKLSTTDLISKSDKQIPVRDVTKIEQQTPESCNKTLALKSILGLNNEKKETHVVTSSWRSDVPKPPKPPSNWRSDALKNQNVSCKNPPIPPYNPLQTSQKNQPIITPFYYYPNHPIQNRNFEYPFRSGPGAVAYRPLQHYVQNLPQFAPQQQLPFVTNDNFYSPTNLSQKGAFIPLQVLRGGSVPRTNSNDVTNSVQKKFDSKMTDRKSAHTKSSVKPPDCSNSTNLTNSDVRDEKKNCQNKKPRMPKIAAKFDYN